MPTLNFQIPTKEQSMPNNNVNDLITDQEKAFVHLILSAIMTDRQAAEAVGLNPDTAAGIKSKPCVSAYMLKHRAAAEQQPVEQETEQLRPFNVSRDRVLTRLWEIANMAPERTRNSMCSQVKAISMIVAIEGLIPDRRAVSRNQPAPPPVPPAFYKAEWLRNQENGKNVDPQPSPAPEEARQEPASEPQSAPASAPNLSESSFFGGPVNPPQTSSLVPRVPMADHFAPDTRAPFSIQKNRFGRRR
jgi:hypothetical protein